VWSLVNTILCVHGSSFLSHHQREDTRIIAAVVVDIRPYSVIC
jgi:hypothetical protein